MIQTAFTLNYYERNEGRSEHAIRNLTEEEFQYYGYESKLDFEHQHEEDVRLALNEPEYAEENEYTQPNFNVLNTIKTIIEGEYGIGFGRKYYQLVDIGIPNQLLLLVGYYDVKEVGEYDITDELVDSYTFIIPKSHYTDYLLTIDCEVGTDEL